MPISAQTRATDACRSFLLLSVKLVLLYIFKLPKQFPVKITNLFQEDTDVHA